MNDRREFLKKLGMGMGAAGAIAVSTPLLGPDPAETLTAPAFAPTWELLDRNMIYAFRIVQHGGGASITANPLAEYRPYLVDLYANLPQNSTGSKGHDLLNAMVDKCLELAMSQDTRGWTVQQWNEELLDTHAMAAANDYEKKIIRFNQYKEDRLNNAKS